MSPRSNNKLLHRLNLKPDFGFKFCLFTEKYTIGCLNQIKSNQIIRLLIKIEFYKKVNIYLYHNKVES